MILSVPNAWRTINNPTTVFCIQSYNDVIGSTEFNNIAKGKKSDDPIKRIGSISHSAQISPSSWINSNTSIYFPDSRDTLLYMEPTVDLNFYSQDFTILVNFILASINSEVYLFSLYYDDNNKFFIRLYANRDNNSYCEMQIYYQVAGKIYLNYQIGWCNAQVPKNTWIQLLIRRVSLISLQIQIMRLTNLTSQISYQTSCPEYLPPLPNGYKISVGNMFNVNGTPKSGSGLYGAIQAVVFNLGSSNYNPWGKQVYTDLSAV